MRLSAVILMTGTLMACGGSSGDVCQQSISLAESESSKIKSCGQDTTQLEAEITALKGEVPQCQAGLKNCSPAELNALNGYISCEQAAISTIQCKWYTEADPESDPSVQAYSDANQACQDKITSVSAACRGN